MGQAGSWALSFVAMELWAALLHGRLWHSWLWPVHRTHHRGRGDIDQRAGAPGRFEANDAMALLHAPIAAGLIVYGCEAGPGPAAWLCHGIGVGMSSFGAAYLFFHDGIAHRRFLPAALLRRCDGFKLCRAIRRSHAVHHRTGQAPFGLFLGPLELARWRRRRLVDRRRQAGGRQGAPLPQARQGQLGAPAQQGARP